MAKTLDGSEQVFAVPSRSLPPLGFRTTGYYRIPDPALLDRLLGPGRFLPRTPSLELDEDWLQIIPYVLPCHRGRVLVCRRGASGSESRLHGRLTVGAGGHWNPCDNAELPAALALGARNCARREVAEEFGVCPDHPLRPCGVLLDARDPVGRVHLGLVVPWRVQSPHRLRCRDGVESVAWSRPEDLDPADAWEGWSGLLLPHLPAIVGPVPAPSPAPPHVRVLDETRFRLPAGRRLRDRLG